MLEFSLNGPENGDHVHLLSPVFELLLPFDNYAFNVRSGGEQGKLSSCFLFNFSLPPILHAKPEIEYSIIRICIFFILIIMTRTPTAINGAVG